MKFALSITDLQEELYYSDGDADVISSGAVLETKAHFAHSFGEVDFREIQLEIGNILISDYYFRRQLALYNSVSEGLIEMHFNFDNPILLGENHRSTYRMECMCHNIIGLNGVSGFVDFSAGKTFKTFDIHLTLDYVRKWFGQSAALDRFILDFEANRPAMLYDIPMRITPAMQEIISQMLTCPFEGFTRKMYLESKVQELFTLQIELTNIPWTRKTASAQKSLSAADLERLHHAKHYIENNLASPKSIEELARICGLNQQKLKSGFKGLFGITVFGYLQKCRMQRARHLLQEGMLASDVAFMVGYGNHSSFSHAFREYFGFSPVKVYGGYDPPLGNQGNTDLVNFSSEFLSVLIKVLNDIFESVLHAFKINTAKDIIEMIKRQTVAS